VRFPDSGQLSTAQPRFSHVGRLADSRQLSAAEPRFSHVGRLSIVG
jgi:hypothetical protein